MRTRVCVFVSMFFLVFVLLSSVKPQPHWKNEGPRGGPAPTTTSVFAIGLRGLTGGYGVFRWTGMNWDQLPGGGTNVTVDSAGNPWIVNASHEIYYWGGGVWNKAPGNGSDVGAGGGKAFAIGTDRAPGGFSVYQWGEGGQWVKMNGGGVRISVESGGNPWVVTTKNEIFRWNGIDWERMPGAATDIGCGAEVWGIGIGSQGPGGNGIYRWDGNGWQHVPGAAVRIDVDSKGTAWIVNAQNKIFQFHHGRWNELPAGGKDIGAE